MRSAEDLNQRLAKIFFKEDKAAIFNFDRERELVVKTSEGKQIRYLFKSSDVATLVCFEQTDPEEVPELWFDVEALGIKYRLEVSIGTATSVFGDEMEAFINRLDWLVEDDSIEPAGYVDDERFGSWS